MKDLQDYLDNQSIEKIEEICNYSVEPSETQIKDGLKIIEDVFEIEMGTELPKDDESLIGDLFDKLIIALGLYINIKKGHIQIIKGRQSLLHDTCEFKMTEKGIKSVESMLK